MALVQPNKAITPVLSGWGKMGKSGSILGEDHPSGGSSFGLVSGVVFDGGSYLEDHRSGCM